MESILLNQEPVRVEEKICSLWVNDSPIEEKSQNTDLLLVFSWKLIDIVPLNKKKEWLAYPPKSRMPDMVSPFKYFWDKELGKQYTIYFS